LIRKFNIRKNGNKRYYASITDMIFSPRCKWLLVSTMDGSVRVYDLMSGLIIDWFQFKNAVTSMSFAVNNTFLATSHQNTMGLHIWANKHHFTLSMLRNVGNQPIKMDKIEDDEQQKEKEKMLLVSDIMKEAINRNEEDDSSSFDSDLDDVLDQNGFDQDEEEEIELPDIASLHLTDSNELITMSSNPRSRWKNLANWDSILQRNRPSMKVKKNVANIPFFIPTKSHHRYIEMDTSKFSKELKEKEEQNETIQKMQQFEKRKKILTANTKKKYNDLIDVKLMDKKYNTCSRLIYFIKKEFDQKNNIEKEVHYEVARDYLLSLSPSASDAELHSIGINIGTAKTELMLVIKFFIYQLETNRNFEHIQAFIALFLKIHSDLIIKHSQTLNFHVIKLKELVQDKWSTINSLFQSNLCLIKFYSHLQQ